MSDYDSKKCAPVANGGVGESGASTMLHYTFAEAVEKTIVLQTVDTSLCPNTGAIGILIVDGIPRAHGDLTKQGSSIKTTAGKGQNIIAIVHTVPLFNEIVCIRLGELSVELQDCGPVA